MSMPGVSAVTVRSIGCTTSGSGLFACHHASASSAVISLISQSNEPTVNSTHLPCSATSSSRSWAPRRAMLGVPRFTDSTLMWASGVWNVDVMMPATIEMSFGTSSRTTISRYGVYSPATAFAS